MDRLKFLAPLSTTPEQRKIFFDGLEKLFPHIKDELIEVEEVKPYIRTAKSLLLEMFQDAVVCIVTGGGKIPDERMKAHKDGCAASVELVFMLGCLYGAEYGNQIFKPTTNKEGKK